MGSGETTAEQALKSMGDAGLGIITAWHYDYKSKDARNVQFVKLFNEMHGRNPDFFSIGGYDGMHVIYETLKKTGGKTDGDTLIAAAKGLKWESPRGPMSIDPDTRDVVQTIYIRRVQKVGGELVKSPFDKVENVKDPVKARRLGRAISAAWRDGADGVADDPPARFRSLAPKSVREDIDAKTQLLVLRHWRCCSASSAPMPRERSRSA